MLLGFCFPKARGLGYTRPSHCLPTCFVENGFPGQRRLENARNIKRSEKSYNKTAIFNWYAASIFTTCTTRLFGQGHGLFSGSGHAALPVLSPSTEEQREALPPAVLSLIASPLNFNPIVQWSLKRWSEAIILPWACSSFSCPPSCHLFLIYFKHNTMTDKLTHFAYFISWR